MKLRLIYSTEFDITCLGDNRREGEPIGIHRKGKHRRRGKGCRRPNRKCGSRGPRQRRTRNRGHYGSISQDPRDGRRVPETVLVIPERHEALAERMQELKDENPELSQKQLVALATGKG